MPWNDLRYTEKLSLHNRVSAACATQDLESLKKLLPTAQDLVEYRNMEHGGGFLHTLMYSSDMANGANPALFLEKVLKAYDLDNQPDLKKDLLLKRNSSHRLAADSVFVKPFTERKNRSDFEQGKLLLYIAIKKQILPLLPQQCKMDAHAIARQQNEAPDMLGNTFSAGTPLSSAKYLTDKDGKPALYIKNSVKEEYPEIHLRNIGDASKGIPERSCAITGLDPNSPLSLKEQIWQAIDFPEDFYIEHFDSLTLFEEDYKRLRQNAGQFASYRYFNQLRGAVVFEDRAEEINGNSSGSYGGYATSYVTQENGEEREYPIIVINEKSFQKRFNKDDKDWNNNHERHLLHELFHQVDLRGKQHFSDMPIFKYAMMLAEQDKKNKVTDPFEVVNLGYNQEWYNVEMAAQIMGAASPEVYKDSPLLARVHKLGSYFAMAKADNDAGILSRLETAMDRCPANTALRAAHIQFMQQKKSLPQYTPEMTLAEYKQARQARETALTQHRSSVDEPKRENLEKHLIRTMDQTIALVENMLKLKHTQQIPHATSYQN